MRAVPGNDEWTNVPEVWRNGAKANLSNNWYDNQYHENSLPALWESL